MRLLIVTQIIDDTDPILGFMTRWVCAFAKTCQRVEVICLREGAYTLPHNVRVWSLGKERGVGRLGYLKNFFVLIWRLRRDYDTVLVHMNHEYVVLAGWLWRLLGKKIGLWYAHGSVPLLLRVAEKFSHIIFTSTHSGFRLSSRKLRVIGQGIDTDFFSPALSVPRVDNVFHVVSVGRISPVKNYETLIDAACRAAREIPSLRVTIVGGAGLPEQISYENELRARAAQSPCGDKLFSFVGPQSNTDIVQTVRGADLFVNTSLTGSLDKAVLEAMACGIDMLTCNEALREVLGERASDFMFPPQDVFACADQIIAAARRGRGERAARGQMLRDLVVRDHDLRQFVMKIVDSYA